MITGAREMALMFDGLPMIGRITETILRGKTIYRDGKVVGSPGDGRPLTPQ